MDGLGGLGVGDLEAELGLGPIEADAEFVGVDHEELFARLRLDDSGKDGRI